MFKSLEEDVERLEGHASPRERWTRFLVIMVLTIVVIGGLYAAITFLD
ncbi:MAG TPA: hypothetical protein VL382_01895 [Terriglobales bacterium]|nr:hypothetical protein [Terriglobales bacterium]